MFITTMSVLSLHKIICSDSAAAGVTSYVHILHICYYCVIVTIIFRLILIKFRSIYKFDNDNIIIIVRGYVL